MYGPNSGALYVHRVELRSCLDSAAVEDYVDPDLWDSHIYYQFLLAPPKPERRKDLCCKEFPNPNYTGYNEEEIKQLGEEKMEVTSIRL